MPWPICDVCGERHRPARFTSGGPAHCWHCGQTGRKCRCGPSLRDWLPILTKHWLRLWSDGPGLSWCRASEPLLFSERHGYTRSLTLFGWRFRLLKAGPVIDKKANINGTSPSAGD